MSNPPQDVFVSHSAADSKLAERFVAVLEHGLPLTTEIRCTSVATRTHDPGPAWRQSIPACVEQCGAHVALLTTRSLHSTDLYLELGARMGAGKNTFAARVPNVDPAGLPAFLGNRIVACLDRRQEVAKLVDEVKQPLTTSRTAEPAYWDRIDDLNALARLYALPAPRPQLFRSDQAPPRLSAEQIVAAADAFLHSRIPMRDGFMPDVVVGVNSGGVFAASVFSEHRPNIRMGAVWTDRAMGVIPDRCHLPPLRDQGSTEEPAKVLVVDSKLRSGASIAKVHRFLRQHYRARAEFRLLVALVYNGWDERDDITCPNEPFWPAQLRLNDTPEGLPLYAAYYTTQAGVPDNIEEPGGPPSRPGGGQR